jgi:predicted permease
VAGGFVIARWIVDAISAMPGLPLPRAGEVAVDWGVIGALATAGVVAALAIGLTPVWLTRRLWTTAALRTGRETADRHTGATRAALVIGQTALAFMLLAAAALLAISLRNLLAEPAGFDGGVSTRRVSAPAARYVDRAATLRFYRELVEALRARPGVEQAGFVSILPLSGSAGSALTIQGREDVPIAARPDIGWQWASPGYFDAIGIRIVRGRDLSYDDLARDTHVTVINETFARLHFPDADPIGRRVYFGPIPAAGVPEWHEIVGVVSDVRHRSLEREPDARAYDLFGQHWGRTISLAVRSAEPPGAVAGMIRSLLAERDPRLAVFAVRSTADLVAGAVAPRRLLLRLVAIFAASGLAVALLGVYGVVAVMITDRRRELGVRIALGASAGIIRRLVIGYGLRLVAVGLIIGLAGAMALGRFIESQLYGLPATDIPALAAAGAALVAAAAVPCLILSNRAARVDPVVALREEP